ncbi:hypothetical protein [Halorussus halophilus]|uniref:hypothetical protein n=1 Tax=Halorussus halophilus TaxID=2650975 RepID=UPI0013017FA5|nr:hypothetical protein [Halorussus halophilus]
MTQLDDSRRRAARGADERSKSGPSDDQSVRGLLTREHCRVGATVEVVASRAVSHTADETRLYRELPVRVDGEPTKLLVGPWHQWHDGERGCVASVSGDECAGGLLTVAIEYE